MPNYFLPAFLIKEKTDTIKLKRKFSATKIHMKLITEKNKKETDF